jgi:hypothetical protein
MDNLPVTLLCSHSHDDCYKGDIFKHPITKDCWFKGECLKCKTNVLCYGYRIKYSKNVCFKL